MKLLTLSTMKSKPMKLAAECVPCPDGCGEPWCPDCQVHYADCDCPGPHSEGVIMAASDPLVVTSRVEAIISALDMRSNEEFLTELSLKVRGIIEQAVAKAKTADRKTLKVEDLVD